MYGLQVCRIEASTASIREHEAAAELSRTTRPLEAAAVLRQAGLAAGLVTPAASPRCSFVAVLKLDQSQALASLS